MNKIRAAVLAVVAVAALAIAIPALAQTASESPSESNEDSGFSSFVSRLAAELGIGEQRVSNAVEQVQEDMRTEFEAERLAELQDRLDQAVEDGDLTRAQADAILEAQESGVLGGPGFHGGPHGGGHHGPGGFGFGGPPSWDDDDSTDNGASEDAQAEDSSFVVPQADVTDL